MTLEAISRDLFLRDSGYVDRDGNPSLRAVAHLIREALDYWGMCPRRTVLKHVRDQFRIIDIPVDVTEDVLRRLISLRECSEVFVGKERYIVPGERVWIPIGENEGVLLAQSRLPEGIKLATDCSSDDIIVRIQVESEDDIVNLEAASVRRVTFAEWLNPAGYLLHAIRRLGEPIRGCKFGLNQFWELLQSDLILSGLPLGEDPEIRVVTDDVGGYFGSYSKEHIEGRWIEDLSAGIWCGYRRGYGERHWHPTLINVDGNRRALDLYNDDEWRWAVLARSYVIGPNEVVVSDGCIEKVTWPLPSQLQAAMDIRGRPAGAWKWRLSHDAPDLWGNIAQ